MDIEKMHDLRARFGNKPFRCRLLFGGWLTIEPAKNDADTFWVIWTPMKGGGFIFQAAQCALVSKKDGSRVPVYDASGVAEAASVLYPARTKNQIETIWAFLVDKIDQAHCRHCKSDDRTQTRNI